MSDKRWTYQVSEWSYDSATGAVGRGTLPLDDQTKADYTDMFVVLTGAPNGNEEITTANFSHYKGLTDLLTEKDAGYADETLDLSALGGGVYLDIYKVTVMDNLSTWIKSGRAQYGLGDGDGEINAESLGANIATITGTGHDDFILGSKRSEIISGGDGNNNFLVGNGGTDSLTGGDGADTFAFNLIVSDPGTATITDFSLTDNDNIFIQTASGTDTTSLTTAGLAIIADPDDSANAQLVDVNDNATIYAIFEDITSAELLTANITLATL